MLSPSRPSKRSLVNDPLLYGLITSYGQLFRAFDHSGFTRDNSNVPAGGFDSVPAMGFQIAAAAIAADIGLVSPPDARHIAERSTAALLDAPREPSTGLLPHWLKHAKRHPASEWSSVDAALACISAIQGLTALGLTARASAIYAQIIDRIDWPSLINAKGELIHGAQPDGTPSPYPWNHWGGELTVVEIFRALSNPAFPPAKAHRDCEHFGGRGFIIELAALFFPQFGLPGYGFDQHGVDWHVRRVRHMHDQKSFASRALFGLSPVEILRHEDATTAYLEGGIGTAGPPSSPLITRPGFGRGPWIAPHYMNMVAGLDIPAATARIRLMRDLGLWTFSGPPEAIQMNSDGTPACCHRVEVSLNAFFNVAGLYHAVCARDSRTDCLYAAAADDPRLCEAVRVVFHGNDRAA